MKKLIIVAFAALALVGCNEAEYKAYSDAKTAIAKSAGEQEVARLIGLTKMAEGTTDPAVKMAAVMAIMQSVKQNAPDVALPQNSALQLVQAITPLASVGLQGLFSYKLGVVQSDNGVKTEGIRYGTMSNIAGAGIEGAGKVTQVKPCIVTEAAIVGCE